MKNKYYIIPEEMAVELCMTTYRLGNGADGFLVSAGDLSVYGEEKALENGAREITAKEAKAFANKHK